MIDDANQAPLIVPYGPEGRDVVETLRTQGLDRAIGRRLQRYVVNLPRRTLEALVAGGDVRVTADGLRVLEFEQLYDPRLGLKLPDRQGMFLQPEGLIV